MASSHLDRLHQDLTGESLVDGASERDLRADRAHPELDRRLPEILELLGLEALRGRFAFGDYETGYSSSWLEATLAAGDLPLTFRRFDDGTVVVGIADTAFARVESDGAVVLLKSYDERLPEARVRELPRILRDRLRTLAQNHHLTIDPELKAELDASVGRLELAEDREWLDERESLWAASAAAMDARRDELAQVFAVPAASLLIEEHETGGRFSKRLAQARLLLDDGVALVVREHDRPGQLACYLESAAGERPILVLEERALERGLVDRLRRTPESRLEPMAIDISGGRLYADYPLSAVAARERLVREAKALFQASLDGAKPRLEPLGEIAPPGTWAPGHAIEL